MEYQILRDFRSNPIEIYDGFEPIALNILPFTYGLSSQYGEIDLIDEIENNVHLKHNYTWLYDCIPSRVTAFNKYTRQRETVDGYFAVIRQKQNATPKILHFSFFDVSPTRCHCYIHAVYELLESDEKNN